MHPVVILVPVAALVLGPRYWVMRVLRRHNRADSEKFRSGREMAKELLGRHGLDTIRVEATDIGDHYDSEAKAVRLSRDKFERRTLAAVTTAAHEVAHALQDASHYGPFVWRGHLMRLAHGVGIAGTVILIAVPATAMLTRYRMPPVLVGVTALAMLSSGLAAQLAALPTELDASFRRAMPLLKDGYIDEREVDGAREILMASSLTYVASSLLAVLNMWPWLGVWSPVRWIARESPAGLLEDAGMPRRPRREPRPRVSAVKMRGTRRQVGVLPGLVRAVGKPLVRLWFRWR